MELRRATAALPPVSVGVRGEDRRGIQPPPTQPITVLIADDHALVRAGLRALLAEAGGFLCAGEAANGREAVQVAVQARPDVALVDVDMPGLGAVETIRQLHRAVPACRVVLLGTHACEPALFDFVSAGASGLVLKEATGTELICALQEVRRNGFFLSPSLSRKVLDRWHRGAVKPVRHRRGAGAGPGGAPVAGPLSDRERELLEHVAGGLPNRQIAARLCISVKTVEAHKAHMVAKLGLRGTNDLVRFAVQYRWPASVLHEEDR